MLYVRFNMNRTRICELTNRDSALYVLALDPEDLLAMCGNSVNAARALMLAHRMCEPGNMFTVYTQNNGYGRQFPRNACLANIKRDIRTLLQDPDTVEIDFVNCHPTLAVALGDRVNVDAPHGLRDYVLHRDAILASDQTNKKQVLAMLNSDDTTRYTSVFARQFTHGLLQYKKDVLAHYTVPRPDNAERLDNPVSSQFNKLMCEYENRMMVTMVDVLHSHCIPVSALLFDGVLVVPGQPIQQHVIDDIATTIHKEVGVHITVTTKTSTLRADLPMWPATRFHPDHAKWTMLPSPSTWDPAIMQVDEVPDAHGYIQPIDPPVYHRKFYVLKAPMGSGKTHQLLAYIDKLVRTIAMRRAARTVDRHAKLRILVVSCRVAFSYGQLHLLEKHGFVHYSERNYTADRMIVQWESLHTLQRQGAVFDYVIVDEMRACIAQMVCTTTNGRWLRTNIKYFRRVCHAARSVVIMCADIDVDNAVPALTRYIGPSDTVIVRYSHCKLARTLCVSYAPHSSEWESRVVTSCASGRVAMLCRTRAAADTVSRMLIRAGVPDGDMLMISGSTADTAVNDSFHDFNATVTRHRIIIFTSKITVGTDITVRFDKVFVHADVAGGCSPRDMLQMIGRFRDLSDPTIDLLWTGQSVCAIIDSVDEAHRYEREAELANRLTSDYLNSCYHRYRVDTDGVFKLSPNHVANMAMASLMENQPGRFMTTLCQLAAGKQWGVRIMCTPNQAMSSASRMEIAKDEVAETRKEFEERVAADMMQLVGNTMAIDTMLDGLRALVEGKNATWEDKTKVSILNVIRRYPRAMDMETLSYRRRFAEQIALVKSESCATDEDLAAVDIRRNTHTWVDVSGRFLLIRRLFLRSLLGKMGFSEGVLSPSSISASGDTVNARVAAINIDDTVQHMVNTCQFKNIRRQPPATIGSVSSWVKTLCGGSLKHSGGQLTYSLPSKLTSAANEYIFNL